MNRRKILMWACLGLAVGFWLCVASEPALAQVRDELRPLQHWRGIYSDARMPARLVIKDPRTWAEIWRLTSNEDPPRIDFRRFMVIACFMGQRPTGGYAVEITGVYYDRSLDRIIVQVTQFVPGPGAIVPQVITSPYHMVLVPRLDKPVHFQVRTIVRP
ncbi:MAG: protease complex subunit PrcB family protein [Gemmatales bacterium]|nr:protease complex subunit PrcB family protein [Gemmatales bacterium]MDW7994194.1 protease complex subunit PrcB family protein [Gemmatales bacterium]